MSISHIPNGFTSITPYFICTDAEAFIKFITEAFDAKEFEMTRENGHIRHFGFKVFGSIVEGSQASGDFGSTKISIHLYVPDCDAVYQKAINAGGKSVFEVTEMPYGERSGGVEDPCGNSWWIATQQIDMYPNNK
jgi:PhnB protein